MGSASLSVALLTYRGNPYSGGQGVYVSHLSRHLVEQGHEVDVLSGPPYPHLDDRVRLVKIPAMNYSDRQERLPLPEWKKMEEAADWMEWFGTLTGGFPEPRAFGKRVADRLHEQIDRYDIVHDNQSLAYGLLDLKRQGLPVVASLHHPPTIDRRVALEQTEGYFRRWLVSRHYSFTRMQKAVAAGLPRLITGSCRTREDIASEYGLSEDKVDVIHYGVDTEVFYPREDVERAPRRLMMVGSSRWLCHTKGFPVLVRAFRRIRKRFGDLELVVVGSTDEAGLTDIELLTEKVAERVAFLQELSTEAVGKLYNRATMVVVPSLYEGFGLPAAEAMACGTPVVASEVGGLPEVVGEAGVLVPPGDPGALAEAIADLLEDPERRRRLGERGQRRVRDRFRWDQTALRTAEVYRETLAEFSSHGP